MAVFNFIHVLSNTGLHVQCGSTGFQGMSFAGDGSAKHRHDAVTHKTANSALVTLDCLAHALSSTVQQVMSIFRIELLGQSGRTDDVSKQHGDRFSFSGGS